MTATITPLIPTGAIGRAAIALDGDGTARRLTLGPVALFVRTVGDLLIISTDDEDAPRVAYAVTANTTDEFGKPWALVGHDPEEGLMNVNTFTDRRAAIGAALALIVDALGE